MGQGSAPTRVEARGSQALEEGGKTLRLFCPQKEWLQGDLIACERNPCAQKWG